MHRHKPHFVKLFQPSEITPETEDERVREVRIGIVLDVPPASDPGPYEQIVVELLGNLTREFYERAAKLQPDPNDERREQDQ